jgi:hypothetical protein
MAKAGGLKERNSADVLEKVRSDHMPSGASKPLGDLYGLLKTQQSPDEQIAARRIRGGQLFVFEKSAFDFDLLIAGREFADQMAEFGILQLPMQNCIFQIGPCSKDDPLVLSTSKTYWTIISAWHDTDDANIFGRIYNVERAGVTSFCRTFTIEPGINLKKWRENISIDSALRDRFPSQIDTSDPKDIDQAAGEFFSGWLFCCIGVLNGRGIVQREVREPIRLNAKRQAKGGPPIFGYRWITIDPTQIKLPGYSADGSHASPRLHWRRGHIRRLGDGRIVMVRPCLVGDVSRGGVEKSYRITSPRLLSAAP